VPWGDELAMRRVGTTLREKYRLDALLGVGGMAAVYRGAHRNGNRVAVKVLHAELAVHADLRSRFLKEGYVANAVDHPGAVRVLDDDSTEDGAVFLVMELLEGQTLGSLAEHSQGRLPPGEVAELASQLLSVLAAAHDKGIVHRDIKPENLFVTGDRVLKVLDFGIARMRDSANATSVTRTGRMMGTPAFMAREQALGLTKEIDGRTDLWAVGATMFSLISGRYVHEAETPESMVVFAATRAAPALVSVAPDVPPPLAAVVDRALAFDKADRFPDARAMLAAIDVACSTLASPAREGRSSSVPGLGVSPLSSTLLAPSIHPAISPYAAPNAPALPEKATLASALVVPSGVSTTSGVASEQPRPLHASIAMTPTYASSTTAPPPLKKVPLLLAMVGGMVAMGIVAGVGLGYSRWTKGASGETRPAPSASAVGIAAPAIPPEPQASPQAATAEPVAPSPIADAGAPLAEGLVVRSPHPAPSAPAPVRRREASSPAPVPTKAAVPDCNPPVYFDPATGKKKVKPGC
jgi:eukaryotic-like serine/threonine-protein kinase